MAERPVALVTGASSGIGAAFARRLAGSGHDLIVVARREPQLRDLAAELSPRGATVEVAAADLTDAADVRRLEERVAAEPRLRLVVNNAGFAGYRPFIEVAPDTIDELLDVHLRSATRLTRAALPGMVDRGAGGVVLVASLLAFAGSLPPVPLPHRSTYAACKAFLVTFAQTLSHELTGTGVQVQVCCPGLVATEFHAVAGMDRVALRIPPMSADDVAAASLRGLELGETVCIPGLDDRALLDHLDEAGRALFRTGNRDQLAERYRG